MDALDILQDEYGKPELVISDVNADLNKLKPPSGEKADQGFVAFVEKVENICRDMGTVGCSGDLKEVTKALLHKQETNFDKSKTHSSYVTGQTFTIQQQKDPPKHPKYGDKRFAPVEPLCMACRGSKNPQDAKH